MILDYVKKCERNMLLSTLLTLILGMVLTFEPTGSIKIITYIVAFLFFIIGVIQLFMFFKQDKIERMTSASFVLGVVLAGIGLLLFYNAKSLVNFITLLIGLTIIVKSLFKLQFAINLKGISDKWFYNLIVGLVGFIIGIILILNPWDSAVMFLRIVGIVLSIGSVIEFIETMSVMKTLDDYKELPFEEKKKSKKDDYSLEEENED